MLLVWIGSRNLHKRKPHMFFAFHTPNLICENQRNSKLWNSMFNHRVSHGFVDVHLNKTNSGIRDTNELGMMGSGMKL